jgi:hypothetical protein
VKIFGVLLTLVAFVGSASLFGQEVEFKALVTNKKIGKFEKFRIDFIVNKNVDDIIQPTFENFAFLGGPSTSVNQSWINGKSSYSKTYSFYLMPKAVGEFTIGSASVIIDGITYKTEPIKITVLDQKPVSKDKDDPDYIASQNIKLKMVLSNASPYVNEQFTLSYYLYFKTSISSPQVIQAPTFNGFWSQDMETPRNYKVEQKYLDDELYQRILLKKTVLIPQKSGKFEIEPLVLQVPLQISTGRIDIFGQRITKQHNYNAATPKRTINIKSLPLKNKPADFSGAVGDFDFDVSLSKSSVKANESITLKTSVKGKGNLRLFSMPEIELANELEMYEPKYSENVKMGAFGLSGSIVNEYIIIPRYRGEYKLPDISFSYFDPKSKKYKTFKKDKLSIEVTTGDIARSNSPSNSGVITKSSVEIMAKDIRYIHNTSSFEKGRSQLLIEELWFFVLLLIPFISFPILLFIYSQNKKSLSDTVGRNRKRAGKIAKKLMADANTALANGDTNEFYISLSQAIFKYISMKFNISQSDLSRDNIKDLLVEKKYDMEDIDRLISVIDLCEMAKYSPVSSLPAMRDTYDSTLQLLSNLEKLK